MPKVKPIAEEKIKHYKLDNRIQVVAGDFFIDPLPKADVITMGMILHNWDMDAKKQLILMAYL